MSIGNKSNLTGLPTEPNRRRSKRSRVMIGGLGLVVFAAGIGLLFTLISARQNVARQEVVNAAAPPSTPVTAPSSIAPSMATKPLASSPVKPSGPAPGKRPVMPQTIAEVRAHAKLVGSQTGPQAKTAIKLKQFDRRRLASSPLALSSASEQPAGTLAASTSVFSQPPLPPVILTRHPVFTVVRRPEVIKPSSSTVAESATADADAPAAKDAVVAADESSDEDAEEAHERKERAEKRMLMAKSAAKGSAATLASQAPPFKGPSKEELAAKGLDGITTDLEGVKPFEYNGDVRDLPAVPVKMRTKEFEAEKPMDPQKVAAGARASTQAEPNIPLAPMPSPSQNFAGLSFNSIVTGGTAGAGWPPDVNGDVGLNHYILSVNDAYAIYSKSGTQLAAFTENSLWAGAGTGTPCDANNFGDPVVVYDQFADRWILTNFAFATDVNDDPIAPYYECFAVSKTSNPVSGGWWLYAVKMDTGLVGQPPAATLADYPKFGNWNDGCLYMAANGFGANGAAFTGVVFASFNKADMESGATLRGSLGFTLTQNIFTMIPSNISGAKAAASLPPAGTPNYFVSESTSVFQLEVRKFTPGANCTGGTLGAATLITQASYGTNLGNVVPQPSPATSAHNLDTLDDRLMQKVNYRRVGAAESLWVTQNTRTSSNTARPRWSQINVNGGTVSTTLVQAQTYAPDTTLYRWMGGIAADHDGNAAMGYSTSNATSPNFPSIAYSGRLVTDALNQLPQTEVQLIAGTGPQTTTGGGTAIHRWGDYTSMSIDPADDCTFWYAGMYFTNVGVDATRNWNTRIGSFRFSSCTSPTLAKVKSFTADGFTDGRVLLRWSSGYEADNLGYNVYREVGGQRVRVNPQVIAGSALVTGGKSVLTAGKAYVWADQLQPGARYWLEDVDLGGKSTFTGPVNLTPGLSKAPNTEQSTLLNQLGSAQAQMTLGQGSVPVEPKAEIASPASAASPLQIELAGQAAVKLSVNREGWYRLTQADLLAAGLSATVDPRNLQLYVDGQPVSMLVNGEQDGRFDKNDSLEFYGLGLNSTATTSHVYWLAAGNQTGTRIKAARGANGVVALSSFPAAVERKDRTIYFSALRNGDAENFFGPVVTGTAVDQSVTLTNVAASAAAPASLDILLQGVTQSSHQVQVMVNGAAVGTVSFTGQGQGKASFPIAHSQLREGVNTVQLIAPGSGDISLVDTVRVSYQHTLKADSNLVRASVAGGQQITLSGFTATDIRVMDVTNANSPQELTGSILGSKASASITLTVPGTGSRALLAFTGTRAMTASAKANVPSNWHQEGRQFDYVMITTQPLMASLAPLKTLRESQGLSVAMVNADDLYDEFSFGNKSVQAIKDFLAFTTSNWRRAPRFVLLAGDSSYDMKNYLGFGDYDVVPSKLFDSAYMEAASDDWFVDFQNNGAPEIAVGRLPVRNAAEASAMVGKIISYENATPSSSVLLVADLDDGHNFAVVEPGLRALLPAGVQAQTIQRGSSDDGTVRNQIIAAINQGQKIVNYNGHGAVNQWRGNILTNSDGASMTNSQKLSLFVMMTCLNGYFNDPALDSLAESVLKAHGGAAAVWASTAQTGPSGQELLNEQVFKAIFETGSGNGLTLGEAVMRAKQTVGDGDVRRSWILFGDPSMKLK
jgi:hypothetical protein